MGSYQLLVFFEKSKLGMFEQNLHTSSTILKTKLENDKQKQKQTKGKNIKKNTNTYKNQLYSVCTTPLLQKEKKKPVTSRS